MCSYSIFYTLPLFLSQQIATNLASFCQKTPLHDTVGLLPSADRPANTVCSYASIHTDLAAKSKSYTQKYSQFVLEYALEWDKILKERVENGIKKAKELRIELDHYQKKVEALRLTVNQAMARGKGVASTTQEKLQRNEEKLLASKQNYNRVATDLSILLEEVVERSWRDLHPLLVKCSQFDMTLAADEAKVLGQLQTVIGGLKQVAMEHGIAPQPRLKDLAGLKPELLSTRPGGVQGLAMLENGNGILSSGATALQPGSVGAQGMGGFPVPISPSDPFAANTSATTATPIGMHRTNSLGTNSLGSAHSAPHTATAMLNTSFGSAPPTVDDVYGGLGGSHNNTNMMVAQPTTPTNNNNNHWTVRSASFNDADSAYSSGGYSQASAPAPMGAPPPPPGSYPLQPSSYPVPPQSMYPPAPAAQPYGAPPQPYSAPPQQQQQQPLSMYPGGYNNNTNRY